MSSPMWDIPDHMLIDVNADGDGPAGPDETVGLTCWCVDGPYCRVCPPEWLRPPYMLCFECRRYWRRRELRIAYIKGYGGPSRNDVRLRSDDFHLSLWRWFVGGVRVLFRPAGRIHFCPACLHDW